MGLGVSPPASPSSPEPEPLSSVETGVVERWPGRFVVRVLTRGRRGCGLFFRDEHMCPLDGDLPQREE